MFCVNLVKIWLVKHIRDEYLLVLFYIFSYKNVYNNENIQKTYFRKIGSIWPSLNVIKNFF